MQQTLASIHPDAQIGKDVIIGPFVTIEEDVIIVDDMIDTAGTITNAANALKERGATGVYACCTHPVLSGPAIERLSNSCIKKLYVLDTIQIPQEKKFDKLIEVSVAPIFADAISNIFGDKPVSKLYDE